MVCRLITIIAFSWVPIFAYNYACVCVIKEVGSSQVLGQLMGMAYTITNTLTSMKILQECKIATNIN